MNKRQEALMNYILANCYNEQHKQGRATIIYGLYGVIINKRSIHHNKIANRLTSDLKVVKKHCDVPIISTAQGIYCTTRKNAWDKLETQAKKLGARIQGIRFEQEKLVAKGQERINEL